MIKEYKKSKYNIFDLYYFFITGIIIIKLFVPEIRLGVTASFIICLYIFQYYRKYTLLFKNSINSLVLLYILYNTITLLWYSISGLPLSVFIREWSNSILPVFFFHFAYASHKERANFYKTTLYALAFSFALGFVFFLWQPYFYRFFLSTIDGVGTNIISTSTFYRSLFGLTATGSLGVIGFILSSREILSSDGTRGKTLAIFFILATILTLRRSALVVLAFSYIAIHYIGYIKYNFLKKRYLLLEIMTVFLVITALTSYLSSDYFSDIIERASSISQAIEERSSSWVDGLKHGNLIIGTGLGAFGHKSVGYNVNAIPDGNYFKMLAEVGVIGTLLFLSIIISSLIKGIKNLRSNYIEIFIIITFCLQAIGSNVFSFQILAPIFWYSVGRLAIKKIKQSNI